MKKKKTTIIDSCYYCYVGESCKNHQFPQNIQKISAFAYLKLLFKVIIKEVISFYTLYFIIIGLLELFPGISTTKWWETFVPLLIVFVLEYLVQAKGLFDTQKENEKDDKRSYSIIRDHEQSEKNSSSIKPGDLIEINDQSVVPCDCILLHTERTNIFINTSKIDGETEEKSRVPIKTPASFKYSNFFKSLNATVAALPAQFGSREVSGEISFYRSHLFDFENNDNDEINNIEYNLNGQITCHFDTNSFIERGSLIDSNGNHLLLALYTGKYCRSEATIDTSTIKSTIIDDYLERITMFVFIIQLIISVTLGILGYLQIRDDCIYYDNLHKTNQTIQLYIPSSILFCKNTGTWMFLTIFIRHFLMLSHMVPITLKVLLPIFRFIYGVFFISQDLNFVDPDTGNKAYSVSTSITETLGALNVIVSDKTGTLTKNKLTLISITIGDTKYGDTKRAPTIVEDQNLKNKLTNSKDEYFILTFQALSVCHTIKVYENQELHGSSQDELAILTALQKLGWEWHENLDNKLIGCPLGVFNAHILKVNQFDSIRKRMSIVVEIDNNIFVFMKGLNEHIERSYVQENGELTTNNKIYSNKIHRTMSISFKQIDRFDERMTIKELEEGHTLLATLGIKDELQNDAKFTLELLSNAGLKIWVATGDAQRNTLVVLSLLGLLRSNEPVIHIELDALCDEAELSECFHSQDEPMSHDCDRPVRFSTKAMLVAENSFITVVNAKDDKILRLALQNRNFLNALYRSRCVVFYCCRPITKSDIVIALQNAGKRVLGVGDGYNDTLLLKASDIGVGIIAHDGSKNFTTCDFALPSFRSLGRLILIHGHQALHRSVLVVHFSFYKAVMFAICQSTYQYWTDFSGQSLFDEFSLFCFNNIWTLLPILSLLFEKDIGENFLYSLSYLYNKLRNPLTLSLSNTTWFFVAIYQGFIIIIISWALTGEAFLDPKGKDYGAPYLSLILYFSIVLISSFYMIYQTNTFTYYSMVLIFGNIMFLIASSAILQSSGSVFGELNSGNWIGFYGECFNNTQTLVIILTIVLAAVIPSWFALTIWTEFFNSDSIRIIEAETNAAKNDVPLFFDPPKNE